MFLFSQPSAVLQRGSNDLEELLLFSVGDVWLKLPRYVPLPSPL